MRRELYKLLNSISQYCVVFFFIGVVGSVLRLGPLRDDPILPLSRLIIITVVFLVLALLVQWIAFLISPEDFENHTMRQRGRRI